MDEFDELELNGRKLLESFLIQVGATNLYPTEDKYAPVDYLVLEKLYRFITLSYLSLTLSGIECFSPAMPLHFGSKIGTSSLSTFFFR